MHTVKSRHSWSISITLRRPIHLGLLIYPEDLCSFKPQMKESSHSINI